MAYKLMLGIVVVVALVAGYFFLTGLADGSVSSFNIALWLAILAALAVVLAGGHKLHAAGYRRTALLLLALVAVPGLLYALFLVAILVLQPRWN